MSSYELTTATDTFYALIEKNSSRKWAIIVGGRKKGCIIINITQYDTVLEGSLNISYDQECNTTGTMVKGVGTVVMLKAAIQFAFHKFPNMTAIYLLDHSHVKCGDLDMYLPPVELAKYGKTWYERKIGAELENKSKQKQIDKYIVLCTENQTWDQFWKSISSIIRRQERYNSGGHVATLKKVIQEYFVRHGGSLRKMISVMKNDQGCKIFVGWLEAYFNEIVGISLKDTDYVIRKDTFELIQINITIKDLKVNPYLKDLEQRKTHVNNKIDFFTSFVPRSGGGSGSKIVGTYLTFGSKATLDDID